MLTTAEMSWWWVCARTISRGHEGASFVRRNCCLLYIHTTTRLKKIRKRCCGWLSGRLPLWVQLEIEKQVPRASFLPTLHFKISNLEFIKENKDPVIFQSAKRTTCAGHHFLLMTKSCWICFLRQLHWRKGGFLRFISRCKLCCVFSRELAINLVFRIPSYNCCV